MILASYPSINTTSPYKQSCNKNRASPYFGEAEFIAQSKLYVFVVQVNNILEPISDHTAIHCPCEHVNIVSPHPNHKANISFPRTCSLYSPTQIGKHAIININFFSLVNSSSTCQLTNPSTYFSISYSHCTDLYKSRKNT
jgi:hypothetical protein